MESQVSYCEAADQAENVFIKDVITSETHHVASNQPAKKQTRQWAAWTRQEEESFFNALRQVGKNFEKITSRVQSKNKDQVRHYYYRLVRRMNKLLGPELSLDAKNSKDTNAAMLRWWSLLEKHSCKASKLHLKPRRFKIFLETLEHQLWKDRKKNIKKRPFQGENCSTTPSHAVSNLVLVDGQNTQNFGSVKGSSGRRSSPVKPARQRRRSGNTSTAAYRKWEKAAIAGVSLVADAAAHLEQTALDKLVDSVQYIHGEKGFDPVAKNMPRVPAFHQNIFPENSSQRLTKLKLQLFPINERIGKALKMDNHNPHLELTLSCRKKISSVLERMNRKWGKSSVAIGELTLLPFYDQNLNLVNCQKWTQDSILSAADVYHAIGSPPIFQLRYGWFSYHSESPEHTRVPLRVPDPNDDKLVSLEWADSLTNISVGDLLSEVSHNNIDANCTNLPLPPGSDCLGQVPFSCDSFDAAIAAHVNKNLANNTVQTTSVSSIWDAEETCDAFTFSKNNIISEKVETNKENCKRDAAMSLEKLGGSEEPMEDYPAEVDSMDECQSDGNPEDSSAKDLRTLTDMYWPESLGPLDLDVPSCRYNNYDLILSDSLGGLTRILTSSLDAFQNCSFFGSSDPREPASTTIGARETASLADQKVES